MIEVSVPLEFSVPLEAGWTQRVWAQSGPEEGETGAISPPMLDAIDKAREGVSRAAPEGDGLGALTLVPVSAEPERKSAARRGLAKAR